MFRILIGVSVNFLKALVDCMLPQFFLKKRFRTLVRVSDNFWKNEELYLEACGISKIILDAFGN